MVEFSDIILFEYGFKEVDKDIRQLLTTGTFKPIYTDIVREFLASEIENCKKAIDDNNHRLSVHLQGSMSEDALTRTPQEINPLLDWLNYPADKRQFWYDYFVRPKFGRQKAPPLSLLQNGDKKVIFSPFGLTTDAFYSVYTEIHELMHALQGKYFVSKTDDNYQQEHFNLLYQGKSRDEAIAIQTANDPTLKTKRHYARCFKEMQANSAATCYMMLKALETNDKELIEKVEKRLLNESASMSGALMNEHLGLAYFEYPATKKIIEEIKQGKCAHLLNSKGLLNWRELYQYTKNKIEEMGYTKEDMAASLETAKMLQKIKSQHKNKDEFLNTVEKEAKNVSYPHNKIFLEFVDAQRHFTYDSSQNLNRFYHRLGAESLLEETLSKANNADIKNIEEYRAIFRNKNKILSSAKQNLYDRS